MATPENPDTPHSDTARVAEALHNTRQRLGRPGDTASDWQQAEKIVQSPLRTALFKLNQPLLRLRPPTRRAMTFVGQDIPRWIFVSLPQVEMVRLVALPLLLAGATSIITQQLQREANQNATLDSYFDHLEKLTFEQGLLDDEPNEGVLLLARGRTIATLKKLEVERANQLIAFLSGSDLISLNFADIDSSSIKTEEGEPMIIPDEAWDKILISFKGTDFSSMDLRGVNLMATDWRRARLIKTNLEEAYLSWTNLSDAKLSDANLENAILNFANLGGVELENANLKGALFQQNNLEDAFLGGANLKGALLLDLNLENTSGISQEQLSQARLCKTILPSHITLDPNRDCESLGWVDE